MEWEKKLQSRDQVVGAVALLYWVPFLLLCGFSAIYGLGWGFFSAGLLLSSAGAIAFFSILQKPEPEKYEAPEPPEAPSSPPEEEADAALCMENGELKEKILQLEELLKNKAAENESIKKEKERAEEETELAIRDLGSSKRKIEETLEMEREASQQKERTIAELNCIINDKQQQIEQLENKIQDLTYEIKTLLQLADMSTPSQARSSAPEPPREEFPASKSASSYQVNTNPIQIEEVSETVKISSDEEAEKQLKRCINIAQKITSSHHLNGYQSRFRDFSMDNYSLDMRRLCDSLRSEGGAAAFVYSAKEKKLLFANNETKNLLGWSPEKFLQDFELIVQEGIGEWKSGIARLTPMQHSKTRLVMKTRSGEDLLVNCRLGLIPTGVFRGNVIGVLYSN